jgi:hypothetical protein
MRTIADEVGSGPIRAVTYTVVEEVIGSIKEDHTNGARLDLGERVVVPIPRNTNITSGLDGKRERCELNLTGGPAPLGELTHTLDNGPDIAAANDNNALARKINSGVAKSYPLKEMYERGDLGINEIENRNHWFASQRFKQIHLNASEPDNNEDNWRELMSDFYEGCFGNFLTSFAADEGLSLSDDMEFEDSETPAHCEAVDNAGWNPYRDSEPHVRQIYAQQVVALMADVLGSDYKVLCAAIERSWTSQQIGETEGYTNRGSASACGKGMLRSALRNLSRFYVCLDRLEERGDRPQDVWPLVGTLNWPPAKYTTGHCLPWDKAFMNQAARPVLTETPSVYKGLLGVSTPRQPDMVH